MEEVIGRWWHNAITRWAHKGYPEAIVHLSDVQKSIGMLFRSAGGAATVRFAPASEQRIGGSRNWLQRLAGSGGRADTPRLEPDVLALPASLCVFNDAVLNRDLYLWLAIQSAYFEHTGDWIHDNCRSTAQGLADFAGFAPRYARLLNAHLVQRPLLSQLKGDAILAETTVRAALQGTYKNIATVDALTVDAASVAPVWLWIGASDALAHHAPRNANPADGEDAEHPNATAHDKQRRRTQRAQENDGRAPFILPFRGEALMSWSELIKVNRSTDDEDDGNAVAAANDMEKLSIAPDGKTLASRVKFDLDLPSTSADDLPLGAGLRMPEWDYRRGVLLPDHCLIQRMDVRHSTPFTPPPALRLTARRVRRRLETMRDAPRIQHRQESGDSIDLDAWVRFTTDQIGHAGMHTDSPPIYTRHARTERSLATLLLADLSLSTDAYATPTAKVIEVIRDALFVFGEALSAVGDPFAMWGFSSVRRQHIRLQRLKSFEETWSDTTRSRVGSIRPGYYTRMGAAIRFANKELAQRPERRRLLMLLTDGKPNDLDIYEGRYGIEDTRQAIHEAHAAGLTPFCVTIDEAGHDYLPLLFGQKGYALVHHPQDLVNRLTQAWATLAQS